MQMSVVTFSLLGIKRLGCTHGLKNEEASISTVTYVHSNGKWYTFSCSFNFEIQKCISNNILLQYMILFACCEQGLFSISWFGIVSLFPNSIIMNWLIRYWCSHWYSLHTAFMDWCCLICCPLEWWAFQSEKFKFDGKEIEIQQERSISAMCLVVFLYNRMTAETLFQSV